MSIPGRRPSRSTSFGDSAAVIVLSAASAERTICTRAPSAIRIGSTAVRKAGSSRGQQAVEWRRNWHGSRSLLMPASAKIRKTSELFKRIESTLSMDAIALEYRDRGAHKRRGHALSSSSPAAAIRSDGRSRAPCRRSSHFVEPAGEQLLHLGLVRVLRKNPLAFALAPHLCHLAVVKEDVRRVRPAGTPHQR